MPQPKSKSASTKDYENIGRAVESVYESGYANRKRVYTFSFTKGIFIGAGTVIGATVIVAILLWILNIGSNSDIPLLSRVSHNLHSAVQSYQK